MQPSKIEFDLGRDQYGRPVHLMRTRGTNGAINWTIRRQAINQRDDTRQIEELPDEIIRRLIEATAKPRAIAGPAPLTDSQVFDLLPDLQNGWTLITYGLWVARAIERAHGIEREPSNAGGKEGGK